MTIEGSSCENCGGELAWRNGVGRLVITHASGHDKCHPVSPVAKLSQADVPLANTALEKAAFLLALSAEPRTAASVEV